MIAIPARFALPAVFAFACAFTLVLARAQDSAKEPAQVPAAAVTQDVAHPAPAAVQHACLDQKERRAEAESGHLIRLSTAMRAARSKMPGTVVGARLCRGPGSLVYLLTVLARDGKVGRITIDATSGVLIGER